MRDGLFPTLSILLNITFLVLGRYLRRGTLSWEALRKTAGEIVTRLRITLPSLEATIGTLSGGNQQRVLLGRWLCRGARIYLLEEPTAGMDVAAKEEVAAITKRLRKEGASILMSSNDPDELLHMCSRVLVLSRRGCIEILADQPAARIDLISALADSGSVQ
jgi:ABC-type sugar transport system ATPase subunit